MLHELIACPTCLEDKLVEANLDKESKALVCENCGGVYPIIHSTPQFIDLRVLLSMNEQYLGAWHISQINSLAHYRSNDPASVALESRSEVQQVISFMDLQGKIVLDIGSGVFNKPGYVAKSGAKEIICLDPIEPESVPNFQLVSGIAEFLPFKDSVFDVITVMTSLDHVIDVPNSLREFQRVLKSDGRIYFWGMFIENPVLWGKRYLYQLLPRLPFRKPGSMDECINHYKLLKEDYKEKLKEIEKNPIENSTLLVDQFHLRHFSSADLLKDLSETGFKVIQCEIIEHADTAISHFMVMEKIKNKFCLPLAFRMKLFINHQRIELNYFRMRLCNFIKRAYSYLEKI